MTKDHAMEDFLDQIHRVEEAVRRLIGQSGLSCTEKEYILNHIVVIPYKELRV
ncbi:hypothetical protein D3C71_1706930 [compost metagenome]